MFLLAAGFLPFLAGYLFWFLPCFLPWWVNKKLDLYIGYSSTVKIFIGFFTFPAALWAAAHFIPGWIGWPDSGLPVALLCLALGLFVEWYQDRWRRSRERFKAGRFAVSQPGDFEALAGLRKEILAAA